MDSAVDRHVFYISDGTAITAEVLGHAVMSQFPVSISSITLPFVENESRARAVKDQIDAIYHQTGVRPLVFYSIVLPEIRAIILQSEGFCQDIVQALVAPLQQEMKLDPTPIAHRTHGLTPGNLNKYDARIAAIDYTLAHDDGISLRNLDQAQVILLGVSRCGKTLPACIWRCNLVSGRLTTPLLLMIWITWCFLHRSNHCNTNSLV